VAAAMKYPVEVQERAVAMVRELEKELGEGVARSPRSPVSWGFIPRRCGTGSVVPRVVTRRQGGARCRPRRRMPGSPSWRKRIVSCGGRTRF
jgi:hypothetical protein